MAGFFLWLFSRCVLSLSVSACKPAAVVKSTLPENCCAHAGSCGELQAKGMLGGCGQERDDGRARQLSEIISGESIPFGSFG